MRRRLPQTMAWTLSLLTLMFSWHTPRITAQKQTEVRTKFDPRVHGFRFVNTFKNDAVPSLNLQTDGLCGGMVYSALDYYLAQIPPTRVDYRPQVGSQLQQYIFGRQVTSLASNLDRWTDVSLSNPVGARNADLFKRGMTLDARLGELKRSIDAGTPALLGLAPIGGDGLGHQVLAIGYDMGRYKGDGGNYQEDLKIFIYDPNVPDRTRTLVPDPQAHVFSWTDDGQGPHRWLTYFVDTRYAKASPPNITDPDLGAKDGLVRELLIQVNTGGDDMRGGSENAQVTVGIEGRPPETYDLNKGRHWIPFYDETVRIPLKQPTSVKDIRKVDFSTTFNGGPAGDQWDVDLIRITAQGGGDKRVIYDMAGRPLVKFTYQNKSYTAKIQ